MIFPQLMIIMLINNPNKKKLVVYALDKMMEIRQKQYIYNVNM